MKFNEEKSYFVGDKSKLTINGDTNINMFSCNCKDSFPLQTFTVTSMEGANTYHFQNTSLNIPIISIDCGNVLMNKEMFKALNGSKHPNITVELIKVIFNKADIDTLNWTAIKAQTNVTINGVTQQYWLNINTLKVGSEYYHFMGEKKLLMSDFKVKPPVAMLGMIRVKDEITIGLDIEITLK